MKYLKLFGLPISCVLVGLISVAGASATTLTSPAGTLLPAGSAVSATSEGKVVMRNSPGTPECESSLSGKTANAGGSAETVNVTVESLTFVNCSSSAVLSVLSKGTLEIHTQGTSADNNGTITWTGLEITQELVGLHCIYKMIGTDMGTITGSAVTGSNATWDLAGTVPRVGGRSGALCGVAAEWSGSYKITSPSVLNVD